MPDLPLEETDDLIDICKNYDIELVLFVSPTSSLSRIDVIAKKSPGCIYLVSATGVTGMRDNINTSIAELSKYIKKISDKFIMLGFGISTPEHVKRILDWNIDGIVVGSAFVQRLSDMKDYLADAPFCDFSARSNGNFDWIELKFFNNIEQANAEADLYRTWFGDIIEDYQSYDLDVYKFGWQLFEEKDFHAFMQFMQKKSEKKPSIKMVQTI